MEQKFSEVFDINPKLKLNKNQKIDFVEMKNIESGKRGVVSEYKKEFKGSGSKFERGDTLFARITPCLENGKISRYDGPGTAFGSTEFIVIRGKEGITLSNFAYYYSTWEKFREFCIQNMIGSSGRQRVPVDAMDNWNVSLPSLQEQKEIADLLDSLDSKIELNQKMNETLEEIAKTLFKSWFIDFDPVRAKAEGRPTGLSKEISDLFPDSFEDSELGEIPRGWKLSNLDSNLEFVLGGDWGKEEPSDDFNKEVVCIRGADIPNLQTFVESNPPKRFIKESSLEKRKLKEGDLVLEISGGSPTQSTGRIVYITEEFLSTQDCPVIFSNFCRILRSDSTLSKYIYYYLRCLYDSDKLFQYETGTTGIKNFGYKYFSEEVFFALPSFDLLKIFSESIETFLIKKGTNLKEIITLTNLRDILLPKLISGELKIPDAENLVEKAGI